MKDALIRLVGDPRRPRRNLWGGLVITALGALLLGSGIDTARGLERFPGAHANALVHIGLSLLFVVAGVLQFRLGMRAVPPTPRGDPVPRKISGSTHRP